MEKFLSANILAKLHYRALEKSTLYHFDEKNVAKPLVLTKCDLHVSQNRRKMYLQKLPP